MFKNYLNVGIRNILRNKLISFFNIFGLALAFGCAIVIFIFIEYNYNVDKIHLNGNKVFLITHQSQSTGREYGTTPTILAPILKDRVPGIENAVRLQIESIRVLPKSGDVFKERVTFSDTGYFSLFDFKLKWGQPSVLSDPSKVIISKEISEKYFGRDNPLGQELDLFLPDGLKKTLIVGAVADEFPAKRSFDFNFLINRLILEGDNINVDWSSFTSATFIKLSNPDETEGLDEVLTTFLSDFNRKNSSDQIESFHYEPLSTLASQSYRIREVITRGFGPPSGKIAFSIIGLLLVTLACLNYINTATALGVSRLKEIGVRKVNGGSRQSIIIQFMVENLIINFFSLCLGVLIAVFFLLPGFANLFQINLTFELNNLYLITFLLGTLLLTSIASGAYPALFISKYKPVVILAGNTKIGTKSIFSKILLSFQFMFSFIYIVASILFVANEFHQRQRDWGYNYENLIVTRPPSKEAYQYIKDELSKRPEVVNITGSKHHLGRGYEEKLVEADTTSIKIHHFEVDSGYIEVLGIRVKEGIAFQGTKSGKQFAMINETFAKFMNWEDPLGKSIILDSVTYFIQGVVADFRYTDFQRKIEPVLLTQTFANHNYLIAKVIPGKAGNLMEALKMAWRRSSPEEPFTAFQQEEIIKGYFILMSGHSKVMIFSALIAVTLSCLGLFGLVYLNLTARIKDYSIMRVLGINNYLLIKQISKNFVWFLIGAICLGFPASIFMSKMLFRIVYVDYISVTPLYPVIGALLLLFIASATVSFLFIKLLKQNPVNHLRS